LFRLCKHGYTPTFWTLVTVLSVSVKSWLPESKHSDKAFC
jgi:hypothetical protein